MTSSTATPYGTLPPASPVATRKPVSLPRLNEMRERVEKITMLTAYDATFAAVADAAGVDCILVGDSLGMAAYVRAVKDGSFPDNALHAW